MPARLIGLALVALAAVLTPVTLATTIFGLPDPGVIAGEPGATVEWVLPGGPTWQDGIRPGQTVIELRSGSGAAGWSLGTTDGNFVYATSHARQTLALREATPHAAAATAAAVIALLLMRRVSIAAAVAAVGLAVNAVAVAPSGYIMLTTVAALAGLGAPTIWLLMSGTGSRITRLIIGGTTAAIAATWVSTRFLGAGFFEPVNLTRDGVMALTSAGVLFTVADWRRWRRRLLAVDRQRTADVVAIAALLGAGLFLAVVLQLSLVVLIVVLVGGLLIYPQFRRRTGTLVDQWLLGDIRNRASIEAIEDERERIARDLHDEPLQEIAAVIRRLDHRPDTAAETQLLRDVADQLRRVTTELRPPVLDDLGLQAAIAFLAQQAQAHAPELEFRLEVPAQDPVAARPPAQVELAVFRIVQEAIDNSLQHAAASAIVIWGSIAPERVRVKVEDDGVGVSDAAAREAALAGHLGLTSMSQRAAAIGAELRIERVNPSGTRVIVEWTAHE